VTCTTTLDFTFETEPKLLKPSNSYTVGRKDRDLLINNKKISHDHCDFLVGPHSVEDVVSASAEWYTTTIDGFRTILPQSHLSSSSTGARRTKICLFLATVKSYRHIPHPTNLSKRKTS